MRLFGIEITKSSRRPTRQLLQYVGDETVLLYGRDEVFVYVDGRDASITPTLMLYDAWEPDLTAFLEQNLKPGQCFVDIGANNGIHSLRAGRLVGPTGMVVAFEPQQRLATLLERSLCANLMMGHVHLRRTAIGSDAGVVQLGKFSYLTGSATLTANSQIAEHEEAPIAPLDAALADVARDIGRSVEPDMIKIDVEGFEYHVWNGMKQWTRGKDHLTIVLEFSPVGYRGMNLDPAELLAEFAMFGFRIERLGHGGLTTPCLPTDLAHMAKSTDQFDLVISK